MSAEPTIKVSARRREQQRAHDLLARPPGRQCVLSVPFAIRFPSAARAK
ncbi:MAG: hypothetical protein ACR2RL_20835 [Gammaproteobacteria bacterium]